MIKKIKNNTWKLIISDVSRFDDIATIKTSEEHGFLVSEVVTISCEDNNYDVSEIEILGVPTATSFTYDNVGADESEKSVTGYVGITKVLVTKTLKPNTDPYIIPEQEQIEWANDPDVLTDIVNNKVIILDEFDNEYQNVNDAVNYIKGHLPSNVTSTGELTLTWEQLKTFYDGANGCQMNYVEFSDYYYIWMSFRDQKMYVPKLLKTDASVFEASYKTSCNIPEAPRVRTTTNKLGRRLHARYVTFTTASGGAFDNTNYNDDDYGDMIYIMKDINGDTTEVNDDAKETWLDWEPMYDYEISGGSVFIPEILTGDLNFWEIHVVAAPDIPEVMGGTIQLIANPRIRWCRGSTLDIDVATNPAELEYSAVYHTNKIRFIIKHPVGEAVEMQLYLKLFK